MPTPTDHDDQKTQSIAEDPARGGRAGVTGEPAAVPGDHRYEPYLDADRPGVARVPVRTDKHQRIEAVIDAADLPLVRGKRWSWSPGKPGCPGSVIWRMDRTRKPSLARVLLGVVDDPEQLICHLNGDRLDCRRGNLVVRTLTDSAAHKRKQATADGRPCTSRFKGVCLPRRAGKWLAYITKDRVQRRLGSFRDEVAAAQAYDEAARELFGEHARLNFPDGVDAWLEREAGAAALAEAA